MQPHALISRRVFLGGFLAVSSAVAATASLQDSVLASADARRGQVPNSTSAPAETEDAEAALKPVRTDFVSGVLVSASARMLLVRVVGYTPNPVQLALDARSEICQRACTASASALKPGDRISAGTYLAPDGKRIAKWVNANVIAGRGMITAILGNVITVAPSQKYGVTRELSIGSQTTISLSDGSEIRGSSHGLEIGDGLHFTGTADVPDQDVRKVWAVSIHQASDRPRGG